MCIFYLIHSLDWGQHLGLGQRNCRTLLIGVAVYLVIFVILKNLQIRGFIDLMYHTVYVGLWIIISADVAVMGYLYRDYFGRNILHELGTDQKKWYYDQKTHTYETQKPLEVVYEEHLKAEKLEQEYQEELDHIKEETTRIQKERETEQRTQEIINQKNQLRAVVKLQRWWRKHLYQPPNGVFYLRAQKSFHEKIRP
jgi:hypothetical protein